MKTDLFQSCGHCWVFQICWHIECSTFTASSFRIWNSLTEIPSPPVALFVVMLPKVHLTSHSRISGSRWVITPSRLSGSWRSFLYGSSVYSFHFFLISSASFRHLRPCYYQKLQTTHNLNFQPLTSHHDLFSYFTPLKPCLQRSLIISKPTICWSYHLFTFPHLISGAHIPFHLI